MTAYMMSAFLAVGTPVGIALPDQDAPRYLAKALYRELDLDQPVSHFEKKYIKLDKRPVLAYIGIVARAVTEKRVTYRWEF